MRASPVGLPPGEGGRGARQLQNQGPRVGGPVCTSRRRRRGRWGCPLGPQHFVVAGGTGGSLTAAQLCAALIEHQRRSACPNPPDVPRPWRGATRHLSSPCGRAVGAHRASWTAPHEAAGSEPDVGKSAFPSISVDHPARRSLFLLRDGCAKRAGWTFIPSAGARAGEDRDPNGPRPACGARSARPMRADRAVPRPLAGVAPRSYLSSSKC